MEANRGRESSWEKARALVKAIDQYSLEMAQGSREPAMYLLRTLTSSYRDMPDKIRLQEIEIASFVAAREVMSREALAIAIANHFFREFNKNFGFGTNASEVVDWDDKEFRGFFTKLGCTLQAILHPRGEYAKDETGLAGHLAKTNLNYYELLNLAENKLTQPEPIVQR